MIRVAIIGTGGIAAAHAAGFEQVQDKAQVVALCDTDRRRAENFKSRFPNAEVFIDWREMLRSVELDAVDICLPHHLHRDCIVDAAQAGKHILCEKPLCLNWQQANDIRQAVEQNRVTLMCAHNQLFDPAVQRARALVEEGWLGALWVVRTVDCFVLRRMTLAEWGWRGKRETMGGGCLIDTGYHPSYLMLYLSNSEPAAVCAMLSHHSANPLEGEDTAEVLIQFKNGVRGTILTSWAYEVPTGHWQFHFIGERGQLYGRGNILYLKPVGWSEAARLELPARNAFVEEIRHFVDCLLTGSRPIHTHEEGIAVLRIILGAYESATQNKIVTFS